MEVLAYPFAGVECRQSVQAVGDAVDVYLARFVFSECAPVDQSERIGVGTLDSGKSASVNARLVCATAVPASMRAAAPHNIVLNKSFIAIFF